MKQFLYVLQVTRPAMLTEGPTAQERSAIAEHFAYLERLADEGTLILAGRTLTSHPETMGLAIFNAESIDEARAVKDADPVIVKTVMTAEVYPYQIALINEGNFAAESA